MSQRLSMKFTASNSNQKIAPVMKIPKTAQQPKSTSQVKQVAEQLKQSGGKPASAWRAAYGGGGSFGLKKGCGCGG